MYVKRGDGATLQWKTLCDEWAAVCSADSAMEAVKEGGFAEQINNATHTLSQGESNLHLIAPFFDRSETLRGAVKGKVVLFLSPPNWVIVLYFWPRFTPVREHFTHPLHTEMWE